MIRLLVGLGNPGAEYESTRHNAGFWWVDAVAARLEVSLRPERNYFGLLARADVGGRPLWLLEPMTYMNLSGKSVAALARFHKIAPHEILVAHDELDLPPGEAKIKQGGSHAGHNGLKDIAAQLGSADVWRLRLGIGHPGDRAEVIHHVLRRPPSDERLAIDAAITLSLGAFDAIVSGDFDAAIRQVHARPARPKPPKPKPPEPPEPPGPPETSGRPRPPGPPDDEAAR